MSTRAARHALLLMIALAACASSAPVQDIDSGGVPVDPSTDAGVVADSGVVTDAGVVTDSGGSTDAGAVVARGSRLLGLDFDDTSETGTYQDNATNAAALKAGATTLSLQWNQIETSPMMYIDPGGALADSNAFYPSAQLELSLTIRSVDTVAVPVPSDLSGTSFDSPAMIARYEAMIDWVLARLPAVTLVSLQIGNEIDVNSLSTSAFWGEYGMFVSQIVTHVHATRPGLLVGFTVTSSAAGGALAQAILGAAAGADLLGITYYPLNADFSVKAPSVVAGDFAAVVSAFGTKPISFQEVGYPSGAANGSSEALQAEFFQNVFEAWDSYASQIRFLSIVRLEDLSLSAAQSTATSYGLGNNEAFVSYLQTLGLRTDPGLGADKVAVAAIQAAEAARGW